MDEPDADELAWMACEQLPPEEDYEEFYEDDGDDASGLHSAHLSSGIVPPRHSSMLKSTLST
jgi:hypothetical protein